MRYYIAYGSNLWKEQMKKRCPDSRLIGSSEIEGYRLLFCKSHSGYYLTIRELEGRCVPVGIWEISEEDEKILDEREGDLYYKKDMKIKVKLIDNPDTIEEINAFAYVLDEDRPCGKPSDEYIERCRKGYNDFGFDKDILEIAFNESISKE